jgi:putative endonuclease
MTVNHGVPGSSPGWGAKAITFICRWPFLFSKIFTIYYIYFLYSETADKYYVGHSQDPWKRLEQHLSNSGNKFTGSYHDWKLKAVFEVSGVRGEADKIEKFIKRQKSKELLKKMLAPEFKGNGVLAQLVRVPHVRD